MKRRILSLSICLYIFLGIGYSQTIINYTESTEIIANPERGAQKYSITSDKYNTDVNYSRLNKSTLEGWRTGYDKATIIFRYFLLDAYLNQDISQVYLDNIQKDFDIIRSSGLKCIVRFSYSDDQSTAPQQPEKYQILTHINQIAPILDANKDVIFSHQAGFIGTWGEWYYTNSDEFGTNGSINSEQWANRKEIIDAMLAATPRLLPIQVRYIDVKRKMYGDSQLTPSTAYQNTPAARIGFYNDAFLNRWGDMATYNVGGENTNPVGTPGFNYLVNEAQYTPMTGETNGLNPPRTDGENALYEMGLTHFTTLSRDYFTANFTNWINSGHYPDMLRRMGYRFILKKGVYNIVNNQLNIDITIENVGFARLFKQRQVFLILKNITSNTEYSYLIETDARTWENEFNITQTFDIADLPQGTYTSYLHLPDFEERLALRPEYSIRFANEGLWDETNGYNKLNYSFDIITGTDCPDVDIVIDGNNAEWSFIPVFAESENQIFKIYDNEEYVAFMFEGDNVVNYQILIDTDQSKNSGYIGHNWNNLGADYRIENGNLNRYTGGGSEWSWQSLGSVSSINQEGVVEVKIAKSYFSGSSFMAGFRMMDASWSLTMGLPSSDDAYSYSFCAIPTKLLEPKIAYSSVNGLVVHPNPASDVVSVLVGVNSGFYEVAKVYSLNGQLVLSKMNTGSDFLNGVLKLDLSDLSEGVYLIVLESKDAVRTGKIVRVNR